ncbi:MAG: hypothetical protein ACP5N3_03890 [Candidatus Nanoarchaeia archaeon]
MVHTSLEDHIEEACPKCGKKHESDWKLEIDNRHHYIIQTCSECSYKIFTKITFTIHDLEHLPKGSKIWHKDPYSVLE